MFLKIFRVLIIASLLLGLAGLSLWAQGQPQQAAAQGVTLTPLPSVGTLISSNGITQSTTYTANLYSLYYGVADCYALYDFTLAQTVTVKMQHAIDTNNYFDLITLPAVITDGNYFTTTAIYGRYLRAVATLDTDNPVTISLKCALKNRTQ